MRDTLFLFQEAALADLHEKIREPLIKAYAASAEPFPFPFCQRFEVSGSKSDK